MRFRISTIYFFWVSAATAFSLLSSQVLAQARDDLSKWSTAVTVEQPLSAADAKWREIMSSGPMVERLPGETHYERFLREVELSKQRRRIFGLAFWREFPEDPRRYSWLIYAVALAPAYPVDVVAWAQAEGRFDNPYPEARSQLYLADVPVDQKAKDDWVKVYPELRAEFMASTAVSLEQRRELQFHELRQEAWRIKRAALFEGPLPQAAAFPAMVLDYYGKDPGGYNYWTARALTFEICRNLETFELDEAGFLKFADRLAEISVDLKEFVDEALLVDHCSPENIRIQNESPAEQRRLITANGVIYPHGGPTTKEGRFIYFHLQREDGRRRAAMGAAVWTDTDDVRIRGSLLRNAASEGRFHERFIDGLVSDLAALEKNKVFPTVQRRDEAALAEWRADFNRMVTDFISDPKVTPEDAASVISRVIGNDVSREISIAMSGEDNGDLKGLMQRIAGFYHERGEAAVPYVYRSLRSIVNREDLFGLEREHVDEYLAQFDHPAIIQLAAGRAHRLDLRSIPVAIAGPTLSGSRLDLEDLRGNIVLLKFWSTNCGSCIAAMPKVQEIYDEYRDRGFEVVAISSDAEKRRKRVERIVERAGSTWPTIIGDAYFDELNVRFGFGGSVPQYMLLDREGRMIADTDELDYGRNLPLLLEEQFALAPGAP